MCHIYHRSGSVKLQHPLRPPVPAPLLPMPTDCGPHGSRILPLGVLPFKRGILARALANADGELSPKEQQRIEQFLNEDNTSLSLSVDAETLRGIVNDTTRDERIASKKDELAVVADRKRRVDEVLAPLI